MHAFTSTKFFLFSLRLLLQKKETCKSDIQSCWIERLVTEGGHILCTPLLATTYTSHSSFFSFPLLFLKVLSLLFHFPLSPHHHKRYRRRCRRQIILYFHTSSRDGTWLFHYSTNSFHSLKLFCRAKLKWIAFPWAKKYQNIPPEFVGSLVGYFKNRIEIYIYDLFCYANVLFW